MMYSCRKSIHSLRSSVSLEGDGGVMISRVATGVIAVQIHSGPPSQAWYKDIMLVELK